MPVTTRASSSLSISMPHARTPRRTCFLDAYDAREPNISIKTFCERLKDDPIILHYNTAFRWLREREGKILRGLTPERRSEKDEHLYQMPHQCVLDQLEVMASRPLSERIKGWKYHAQHAGCSARHSRRLLQSYRQRWAQASQASRPTLQPETKHLSAKGFERGWLLRFV
jgi:hypothetical protein